MDTAGVEMFSAILTALAIAAAWLVFRIERAASRRREIVAARGALIGVQRGMLEGRPAGGDPYVGWGTLYFGNEYTATTAYNAGLSAARLIEQGGSYQVFAVPTTSLERLATADGVGDLLSEETIFAANFALWRLGVFNQFVEKQTTFNVQHAAEIADDGLPTARRKAIAIAAQELNIGLHLDGIGLATRPEGWFGGLTAAVEGDIERLNAMESTSWWRYSEDRHFAVIDAVVAALIVAVIVLAGVNLLDRNTATKEQLGPYVLVSDPRCVAGDFPNGGAPPWVRCA